MSDQHKKCIYCGREFTFTEGEREFYASKGLSPKERCGQCLYSRKSPPPSFVIVWDPEVVSEADYADLVSALGNLVRSEGGIGIQRMRAKGFGVPCEAGVTL